MKIFTKTHYLSRLHWLFFIGIFFGLGSLNAWAESFSYQKLHEMNPLAGNPTALVRDTAGNFYGIAQDEGENANPVVYKLNASGNYSILHEFDGGNIGLNSDLTLAPDGSLYGTTSAFSNTPSYGSVFKIDPNGVFSVVHNFSNDGTYDAPGAGVSLGPDGSLYGTTTGNFTPGNYGKVYKISPDGTYSVIHAFDKINGATPVTKVTLGQDGSLYGVTSQSNNFYTIGQSHYAYGTIYKIAKDGSFSVLHFFDGTWGNRPRIEFVLANNGNLYGVSDSELYTAANYFFEINTNDDTVSVPHNFSANNFYARGSLILDSHDTLLGRGGENSQKDAFFKIDTNGTMEILHNVDSTNYPQYADRRDFTVDNDNNFYFSTGVGKNFSGAIAKIDSASNLSTVYDFRSGSGSYPIKTVVANDGSVYGVNTTGNARHGSIFKIASDGTYSEPLVFNGTNGSSPKDLVLASDGTLYGITKADNPSNGGTFFKLEPNGNHTVLYKFEGIVPDYIKLGADGHFYYVTFDYQTWEIIKHKITKDGEYSEVYRVQNSTKIIPFLTTTMGQDGSFYGYTHRNPNYALYKDLDIYKITPEGTQEILYTFNSIDLWTTKPVPALAVAEDGNLYGALPVYKNIDGEFKGEYFFKLNMQGVLTNLYSFHSLEGDANTDILIGNDGSLYSGNYKLSPTGKLTVILPPNKELVSISSLSLANNGSVYGTVSSGGRFYSGLVFKLTAIQDYFHAVKDTATTGQDQLVSINLLANDYAGNKGKTLDLSSIAIVAGPSNGGITINGDGSVLYTPNTGFGGTDTFRYTVKNSVGAVSNAAKVTVYVPVAIDDNYSVTARANAGEVHLKTWRQGVDFNDLPKALNPTFSLVSNPIRISGEGLGTLTINTFAENGTFSFVLTGVGDTPQQQKASKRGVFEFSYKMNLNGVTTAPAKVTITVN